jgi:hypothetical protein
MPLTKSKANIFVAAVMLLLAVDKLLDVWSHFSGQHTLSLARLILRALGVVIWPAFAVRLLRMPRPFFALGAGR